MHTFRGAKPNDSPAAEIQSRVRRTDRKGNAELLWNMDAWQRGPGRSLIRLSIPSIVRRRDTQTYALTPRGRRCLLRDLAEQFPGNSFGRDACDVGLRDDTATCTALV